VISEPNNKFVSYHAFQTLLLWAFWFLVLVVFGTIFSIITFGIGLFLMIPVFFVPMVLDIYLAVKAYGMEKVNLPVISDLAEQWS
jgi:uncharacterized membrane protein